MRSFFRVISLLMIRNDPGTRIEKDSLKVRSVNARTYLVPTSLSVTLNHLEACGFRETHQVQEFFLVSFRGRLLPISPKKYSGFCAPRGWLRWLRFATFGYVWLCLATNPSGYELRDGLALWRTTTSCTTPTQPAVATRAIAEQASTRAALQQPTAESALATQQQPASKHHNTSDEQTAILGPSTHSVPRS
jgi:hypothetical protein